MIGAISNGDVTESDMSKLRRLLPYQNLFYLRRLFNAIEEGANEAFGVPTQRRRR